MTKYACKLIKVDDCNNCPYYTNLASLDVFPYHYCELLKNTINMWEFPNCVECPLPTTQENLDERMIGLSTGGC